MAFLFTSMLRILPLSALFPYTTLFRSSSIHMWSSENAGTLDLNAEIQLWTRAGQVKISVGKNIDVRRLDHLIANAVLRRSEEHTSELQSRGHLVCRLLLEKKKHRSLSV